MKKYHTPYRSRVVKTWLTDEEYLDFAQRFSPYNISQSEFLRQVISTRLPDFSMNVAHPT